MTQDDWNQAQSKDPINNQMVEAIQKKTIGKLILKSDMDFDPKSLIRIRKYLTFIKKDVI